MKLITTLNLMPTGALYHDELILDFGHRTPTLGGPTSRQGVREISVSRPYQW